MPGTMLAPGDGVNESRISANVDAGFSVVGRDARDDGLLEDTCRRRETMNQYTKEWLLIARILQPRAGRGAA